MSELCTCGSHHHNTSVMYSTQNLFPPGKQSQIVTVNSDYMIVFKNLSNSLGITTLAQQMYAIYSSHFTMQQVSPTTIF